MSGWVATKQPGMKKQGLHEERGFENLAQLTFLINEHSHGTQKQHQMGIQFKNNAKSMKPNIQLFSPFSTALQIPYNYSTG